MSNTVNFIALSDILSREGGEMPDQMHFEIINCIRLFSLQRYRLLITTFVKNTLEI